MFKVYIIYSNSFNVYYKGYTTNVEKRIQDHNTGLSNYTKGKEPWRLVYLESFTSKSEVLKRELQLKKQNRKYIQWLINSDKNEIS